MLEKSSAVDALCVEVEGECHDVDIARALTVSEQRALDPFRAGHYSEFRRSYARCRGRYEDAR